MQPRYSFSPNELHRQIFFAVCGLFALFELSAKSLAAESKAQTIETCKATEKAISEIATLRKSGRSKDEVQTTLKATVPRTEKEIRNAIDLLVDTVYAVDSKSLEKYPIHAYHVCVGNNVNPTQVSSKSVEATLSKLRVQQDRMTGISWYFHPTSPKSIESDGLYLYFGRNDSGRFYVMHLITRSLQSDWLFVKDVWAKTTDGRVQVPLSSTTSGKDWLRDHARGMVWEEFDSELISKADISAVRSIAFSKDVTLRFEGSKYYRDRRISQKELSAMREMIQAYEVVTGKEWK